MKCSRCGGVGHNVKTCGRKAVVTADGVRVRQVAPGVSGSELAELKQPKRVRKAKEPNGGDRTSARGAVPARGVRPDPTRPDPTPYSHPVDVELRVRVRIEVAVVTVAE